MPAAASHAPMATPGLMALLPIMGVVFTAFLVVGLAMPVLPLHVHGGLGFGAVMVGLVAGSQFAASLVSRVWSGHYADSRGTKRAVVVGLLMTAASGLLYLLSLRFLDTPAASVAVLLLGRTLLGGAESFVITGALAWGLALVNARNTGRAIAWIGTAMYAAWALGAPAGVGLCASHGFVAIALATALVPLATPLLIAPLRPVAPQLRGRPSIAKVVRAVWIPGVGLAFSSIGFGAMTAFVVLLFAERGWNPVWLPFSAFAVAFILVRAVLGHLPDRFGGAKVALVFLLVEAAGQALIWLGPGPGLALVGAALTGFGYSLVYPGLGVEAVRRAPPESRGLAMGAYTAFLDLALGVAGPVLGPIAAGAGLGSVFLASALAALCGTAIALQLLQGPSTT